MFPTTRRDHRWAATPYILTTLGLVIAANFITLMIALSLAVRSDPYPHLAVPSFFTLALGALTFASAFLQLCGFYTGYLRPQVVVGLSVVWMVGWAADVVLMVAYLETGSIGGLCRRQSRWEKGSGMRELCQSGTATVVFAMVNLLLYCVLFWLAIVTMRRMGEAVEREGQMVRVRHEERNPEDTIEEPPPPYSAAVSQAATEEWRVEKPSGEWIIRAPPRTAGADGMYSYAR